MIHLINLRYATEDQSVINMDVETEQGTFPFTLTPTDDAPMSVAVREELLSDTYEIAAYTPPPPPPAPTFPPSARQIRLALNALELRATVELFVASQAKDVQDSWEYSTQFVRDHPLILGAQQALGKTDAEVDALFALARTL